MISEKIKSVRSVFALIYEGYGQYNRTIVFLVILGILAGFLEAIGINAVIPLFSFITGGGGIATDSISNAIEQIFVLLHIPYSFRYVLLLVVVLFVSRAFVLLVVNYIRIKITAEYEEMVRNTLFKNSLQASWPHLLSQKLGHLETVLLTNVRFSERLLSTISNMVVLMASWAIYLVVAINISPTITFFSVGLGILLLILFMPFLRSTKHLSSSMESMLRETAHHINQNTIGLKTVKSFGVGDRVYNIGAKFFAKLKVLKIKISFLQIIPTSFMQPIGVIFVVVVFAFSYTRPEFNLAAFVAIVYLIQRMSVHTQQIQTHLHYVSVALPYLEELLRTNRENIKHKELSGGSKPFIFKNSIDFNKVSFSYLPDRPVVKDATFSIDHGNMVGIIGPSGSGKTTIVDLLLRLFSPTDGTITVDGVPIHNTEPKRWQNSVGYVSQDVFLLNDTIASNIRFYDNSISDAEIVDVAEKALVNEFASTFPKGLDTVVGERGIMLSGGQRQRIIIARALARKPSLLVLDEATSSLDTESELQIQAVIERLRGKLTVLVIAHRLSTVAHSDKIIVLDDGSVVESGSPKSLLKDTDSYFYRMYATQTNKSS